MFRRMITSIIRRPLYSAVVILFAAVLAVVACYLHKSGIEEQKSFEASYASVPVTFRVTDLDGSKPGVILGWIVDLFDENGLDPNFAPYVDQLHVRVSYYGNCTYIFADDNGLASNGTSYLRVAGITSLYVAEELTENWGGEVCWKDGYDESILGTEEEVCLVPESMKDAQEVKAVFDTVVHKYGGEYEIITTTKTLRVAGYYVDYGNSRIYCPYSVMERMHAELGISKEIKELCAILNDNNNLASLKQTAAEWFAEPNAAGEPTPWNKFGYEYFLYALDIEDTMLHELETSMKNSMRLNKIASVVVLVLSGGAGFLTGFLVIRARKREIALMRTMGASHPAIFLELVLEQMACVAVGILAGGAAYLWQPVEKLALFGGIYFVGLTTALLVFLYKNLLTIIKEDE